MTQLHGLDADSQWAWVVRRPPATKLLCYLLQKWQEYEVKFAGHGEPLATRDEPALTTGLGAYLDDERAAGHQPFDGEFFPELCRYDLQADGKPRMIGRSDIEWRLSGAPNFVVEFKVVGGGRPAKTYVIDGMFRFVDGRYAPKSTEGAMWAFIRPNSTEGVPHIEGIIDQHLVPLRCLAENGMHRIAPSALAPGVASFDSLHDREQPALTIRLAHIFVKIGDDAHCA